MQILELDTVRNSFNLSCLKALNFSDPLNWRMMGLLRPKYKFKGIHAWPYVVAVKRTDRVVVVVYMVGGQKPEQPSIRDYYQARFDAYVVSASLRQQGHELDRVVPWIVYDDAERHELPPVDLSDPELENVVRTLRRHHDTFDVETDDAASLISNYRKAGKILSQMH